MSETAVVATLIALVGSAPALPPDEGRMHEQQPNRVEVVIPYEAGRTNYGNVIAGSRVYVGVLWTENFGRKHSDLVLGNVRVARINEREKTAVLYLEKKEDSLKFDQARRKGEIVLIRPGR